MPVCYVSAGSGTRSGYCVSVGALVEAFPLQSEQVSLAIANLAGTHVMDPDLTKLRIRVGCIPEHHAELFIGLPNENQWKAIGTSPCSSEPSDEGSLLTEIIRQYPRARASGLAFQESYEKFYAECMAVRDFKAPASGGGATTETEEEKKKREEAEKKKAEEAAAKREAERQREEAAQKRQQAEAARAAAEATEAQAQQTWSDPNASQEEKNAATQQMLAAWNTAHAAAAVADQAEASATQAQRAAETATLAAEQAMQDYRDALVDEEYGRLVQEIVNEFGEGIAWDGEVSPKGAVVAFARFFGAWWGTYGRGGVKECVDDMSCSMSCESMARVQAIKEELRRHSEPKCNTEALPVPDSIDRCYGSLLRSPQISLAAGMEWACQQQRKIGMVSCALMPPQASAERFDPCRGELVMCPPEGPPAMETTGAKAIVPSSLRFEPLLMR